MHPWQEVIQIKKAFSHVLIKLSHMEKKENSHPGVQTGKSEVDKEKQLCGLSSDNTLVIKEAATGTVWMLWALCVCKTG